MAVDGLPFYQESIFDYAVPEELSSGALPGARVSVPFRKTHRPGFLLSLSDSTAFQGELRPIASVADDELLLPEELLLLGRELSDTTLTPPFDCLRAMLPAGLALQIDRVYSPGEGEADGLEGEILGALRDRGPLREKALEKLFGKEIRPRLSQMVNKGLLRLSHIDRRAVGDRTIPTVRCTTNREDADYFLRKTRFPEKHRPILDYLLREGECDREELCYMTGATQALLQTLIKYKLAAFSSRPSLRIPPSLPEEAVPRPLSEDQERVFREINETRHAFGQDLLYGVTGSGKTHVFYALIEQVLQEGRGVIVMVPEIMLSVQLIARLKARFGDTVAVIHSDLSAGERLDEWKRLREGKARIAVGTRSAVFAPLDSIGLIILDEEQEHTYKSDQSPRYHARTVARWRAAYHHCPLLLASATPSLETRHAVDQGKVRMHELSGRFNGRGAPPTRIIDLRAEMKEGNSSLYSMPLQRELALNLQNGEQSILFLNRRGFNTFLSCRDCGEPILCPHCSIAMTYHLKNNRLMCHYCGASQPVPEECPSCKSKNIRYFGTGTQKAELELAALFPQARILRMDADTTAGRFRHEELLSAFARGDYDILLGTQMVTKGLDFPNVTLVGVLAADSSLYSDDYRASERTFSLITQVIGRAGRAAKPGRALIQTYSPDHETLTYAVAQNYEDFYHHEIPARKMLLYPPFSELCQLVFSSENPERAQNAAIAFSQVLRHYMAEAGQPMIGIGPAPCKVARVGDRWRVKLLLKVRANRAFLEVLRLVADRFAHAPLYRRVRLDLDINPTTVL